MIWKIICEGEIWSERYINDGVILLNLKKIRNDKKA